MMKPVTKLKKLAFLATAIYSLNAFAYDDDKKKEICRQPKIQEFTLPEYSESNKKEAEPEADFTFVVSGWANPKKFKLTGKGKDIPFTVQSTETFHKIKAKLPADFTGETVRINARIPALLGCYSTIGWLVKVADKPNAGEEQKPAETAAPQNTPKAQPSAPATDPHPPAASSAEPSKNDAVAP
jgi:hypothetical protein